MILCEHYYAMIVELWSAFNELNELTENEVMSDKASESIISYFATVDDFVGDMILVNFERRVPVKIEKGIHKGKVGTIAGSLSDRKLLRDAGLTRAIVVIGHVFAVVPLDYLRELSAEEMILLGIK